MLLYTQQRSSSFINFRNIHTQNHSIVSYVAFYCLLRILLCNAILLFNISAKGPFCGNGLVEDGEECDCGFDNECEDPCCNPKMENDPNNPNQCRLKTTHNSQTVQCR